MIIELTIVILATNSTMCLRNRGFVTNKELDVVTILKTLIKPITVLLRINMCRQFIVLLIMLSYSKEE